VREENKKTSDLVEGGLGVAAGGHGHAGFYRSGGPRELSTSFDFLFFYGTTHVSAGLSYTSVPFQLLVSLNYTEA